MHHCCKFLSTAALFCALAVLSDARPASAQQHCLTLTAVPEGASLVLRGTSNYASGAPGNFCALTPETDYRLTIARPGYETRNLKLRLGADGDVDLSGVWFGPLARSTLVPGWGQMSMGNKARGVWAFTIGASSGGYLLWSYLDYDNAKDDYDRTLALAESATTQQQLEQLEETATRQAMDANVKKARFDDVLVLTAYIHATNMAETFLLARPPKSSTDGSTVNLETARLTNARATVRSMLFPGLGQKYMGSNFKGWFMQSLFLGVSVWAIEERADYAKAKKAYEFDQWQLDHASTVDEIAAAAKQVDSSWDYARKRERRRNISYITVGAAWLWNVLDAALVSTPKTPGGKIGFETSFRGSSVETGSFGTTMTWRF